MGRRSPSATALRSAPAQNVPPAPVEHGHRPVVVGVEGQEGLPQLVGADAVDGVAALGPVDGDHRDRAVVLDDEGVGPVRPVRPDEGSSAAGAGLMEAFSHGGPGSPHIEFPLVPR